MKCHGVLLIRLEMSDQKVSQYFRTLHVTHKSEQLMMVLLKKSVQAHSLQYNFPALKYLKVKKLNSFMHAAFKFKLVFSNEMF